MPLWFTILYLSSLVLTHTYLIKIDYVCINNQRIDYNKNPDWFNLAISTNTRTKGDLLFLFFFITCPLLNTIFAIWAWGQFLLVYLLQYLEKPNKQFLKAQAKAEMESILKKE